MPQGTQAVLLSTTRGDAFSRGRWVRHFSDADDLDGRFNHLRVEQANLNNIAWLMNAAPAYGDALDADARRHPGNFQDFLDTSGGALPWHLGGVLVVGGQYRSPYGTALLDEGGAEGTITMLEMGGTFSSSKVEVNGATDRAGFKTAFANLSSKSVKFV